MNTDSGITATVAAAQVAADTPLGGLGVRVVAAIQDVSLNVAVDPLHRVVVGTALRQADPVQLQFPHGASGLMRLARMCRILVQRDPYLLIGIPTADPPHEPANRCRVFAGLERPVALAASGIVKQAQVEPSARLLRPGQHQFLRRRILPPAIRLYRHGLDVEEHQDAPLRQMPPNPANPGQNGQPLRVGTDQLPLDRAEVDAPFLSN